MKRLFRSNHSVIVLACLLAGCVDKQTDSRSQMAAHKGSRIPEPRAPVEQELGPYRKDAAGGFSHRWLAYLSEPPQGSDGPWFVALNGERLGPFAQVSSWVPVSPDGQHVAFVAKDGRTWSIFLDGERKWTHPKLAWADFTWTPNLEGNTVRMQTRAADLEFSQYGNHLVYEVQTPDKRWAVAVDGQLGPAFRNTSSRDRSFVAGQVLYSATVENGEVIVHGSTILGPFDKTWLIEHSPDGNHFAVVVVKNDEYYFVIDGREIQIPGEPSDYSIGNGGKAALSYETGAGVRVWYAGGELPGRYEAVALLTVSPDGKHLAFWAKQAGQWFPVIDSRVFPGFDGYFLYRLGRTSFAFHWGLGSNISYYARKGKEPVLSLNGEEVTFSSGIDGGIPVQAIVDDLGNIVGTGIVGGSMADSRAFVQCLLTREQSQCDPKRVSLVGGEIAFVDSPDKQAFVVVGQNRNGPYPSVKGDLLVSPEGRHYAVIVANEENTRQQVILDGELMPFLYDAIYRLSFLSEDQLAHLGVRDGKVFGTQYPVVR